MSLKRIVMTVMAAGVIGSGAPGCGVPHPGVSNGSLTACYRAIPAANAAVHTKRAKLRGVHRLSTDAAAKYLPPSAQIQGENDTAVCAVSFEGSFVAGQVEKANPAAHGRYAIVLVALIHPRVLASFVVDQLPKRFRARIV